MVRGSILLACGRYLGKRCDTLEDDIDKFNVERRCEERVERLIEGLELINVVSISELRLVDLAKELVDQLEDQHSEKWLIKSDQRQEDTS